MAKRIGVTLGATVLVAGFLAAILFPVFAQAHGKTRRDFEVAAVRRRMHVRQVVHDVQSGKYDAVEVKKVIPYIAASDPLRYDFAQALHKIGHDDLAFQVEMARVLMRGKQTIPDPELTFYAALAKSQGSESEAHRARSMMHSNSKFTILP